MTRHRRITPTKRQTADMLALGFEWRDFHQAFAWRQKRTSGGYVTNGWVFPPMHDQNQTNRWAPRNIASGAMPYDNGPGFPDPITAATWLLIESASV